MNYTPQSRVEGIRFERMRLLHLAVFKTAAIGHSANPLKYGKRGSNPQHPVWKTDTLPIELLP